MRNIFGLPASHQFILFDESFYKSFKTRSQLHSFLLFSSKHNSKITKTNGSGRDSIAKVEAQKAGQLPCEGARVAIHSYVRVCIFEQLQTMERYERTDSPTSSPGYTAESA